MKADTVSTAWKSTSLVMIVILTLAACAPASTPVSTATPLPPTATATPSPTLTPSPTATVTVTPSPAKIAEFLGLPIENEPSYRMEGDKLVDESTGATVATRENGEWKTIPWINLLKDRGEYRRPDIPLVMGGVSPAAKWEIDSRMSAPAVYEDIVAAMIKHVLLPENEYILKQMIAENPEWAELPALVGPYKTTNHRPERTAFMMRFMEISKGLIFLKMWPSDEVALVDFNKPVIRVCESVDTVLSIPKIQQDVRGPDYLAYGAFTSEDNNSVIYTEVTPAVWETMDDVTTRGGFCSWGTVGILESLAQMQDVFNSYGRLSDPLTNLSVYVKGADQPMDYYNLGLGRFNIGIIKANK